MLVIAFRIAVTLDVKIRWIGVAVCVNKWPKNANFGFSLFKTFNFDCLLLKLLICSSRTKKTYSAWFFLCGLGQLTWFQGLKYIPPSFLPRVTNQKSWKSDFLCHCSFIQCFYDAEILRRKPKTFVKVIQRFWYIQNKRLTLKKFHQKQPKFQSW